MKRATVRLVYVSAREATTTFLAGPLTLLLVICPEVEVAREFSLLLTETIKCLATEWWA